jgi:hypothetical protein
MFHSLGFVADHVPPTTTRKPRGANPQPKKENPLGGGKKKMGFLYALATPSMYGIVKIGATTRDVGERLCEANSADTWRPPEPYALVCCVEVDDPFAVEQYGARHDYVKAHQVGS